MKPSLKRRCLLLTTKILIWSLVLSVLMASLPIPIAVVSQNTADDIVPFPCRDGKCGCKSALQCWTSCCCNSPQQRLDWAAKNGVEVPEYGQHLKQLVANQKSRPSSSKPTCCQKAGVVTKAAKSACCDVEAKADAVDAKVANVAKPRTKIVLSMLALGCRGSIGELASLPWAIVVVPSSSGWSQRPLLYNVDVVDDRGPTQFYPPELPPPRLS